MEIEYLIDSEYFLYSALFRLHACYDKIAVYINDKYNCHKKVKYFSSFRNTRIKKKDLNNKVKAILNNDDYKLLNKLRNNIFHNLRCGALYGNSILEHYNCILIKVLFENLQLQFELLNFLL